MKRVQLGFTGISIFPLNFGTFPPGPFGRCYPTRGGGRLIRHALDQGITMLHTAAL